MAVISNFQQLSYQGFIPGQEERSRRIIEERNWRELAESMQESHLYPGEHPGYPDTNSEHTSPWDQDLDSGWKCKFSDNADTETDEPLKDRNSFSLPHNASVPAVTRPSKAEQDKGSTRPAAEKSFTIPRMDSAQHPRKTSTSQRPDDRSRGRDIGKLASTAETKIYNSASSEGLFPLRASPYMRGQSKRSKRLRKKDEISAPAKKRGHVPPTVTEKPNE